MYTADNYTGVQSKDTQDLAKQDGVNWKDASVDSRSEHTKHNQPPLFGVLPQQPSQRDRGDVLIKLLDLLFGEIRDFRFLGDRRELSHCLAF